MVKVAKGGGKGKPEGPWMRITTILLVPFFPCSSDRNQAIKTGKGCAEGMSFPSCM